MVKLKPKPYHAPEIITLAARVLVNPESSYEAKRLAGSILGGAKGGYWIEPLFDL